MIELFSSTIHVRTCIIINCCEDQLLLAGQYKFGIGKGHDVTYAWNVSKNITFLIMHATSNAKLSYIFICIYIYII